MFHFLARLGRTKVAYYFVPSATFIGGCSILGFHSLGHDLVEKFFGASHPDGTPIKICDHLRNLISEVYDEAVKDGKWHHDSFQLKTFKYPEPIVRWFASSTIDPFVLGFSNLATGVTIAVPSQYNYERPEDLPESLFEIKQISFFRSLALTDQQKEDERAHQLDKEAQLIRNAEQSLSTTLFKIDRNSEEGKEYIDSLLLSDNAKRYSIMKELYIADSYKPLLKFVAFILSMTSGHATAGAYVKLLKLKNAHVSQRLPGYAVSATLAYGMHYFLTSAVDAFSEHKAHKNTLAMGDRYKDGAREFYKKLETRNMILGLQYSWYRQRFKVKYDDILPHKDEDCKVPDG